MRRVVALVLVLALAASAVGLGVVLYVDSGSSSAGQDLPSSPLPSASGAPTPAANLSRFYGQKLAWSGCGSDRCAKLTVPLDYASPDGATIQLAVLKVPARGKSLGPLVVNPGGPGASGVTYAQNARQFFGSPLLQDFDIVGFDPRGVGQSAPVSCLDTAGLDAYIASDPEPQTPEQIAAATRAGDAFDAACVQHTGTEISHVSTVDAARDMDVLRAALGEQTLTYFGASYGTKLGATYAQLFPKRVGRFVLDGAVDVSLDPRDLALQQAAGFETALRAYVQNCVDTTSDCFLGHTVDEGIAKIQALLAHIEASPLPTDDGRKLTLGNAFFGTIMPLYRRDYWILLSSSLRAAMNGDGTSLMQLADIYTSRGANGYTDNSMAANLVISCLDNPWSLDPTQVAAQLPAFEKASPTFGRAFAWSLTACHGFTPRSGEKPLAIHARGAAPIVVVGTTRDPATPFAWAERLASQLASGVLIKRDGDGHTGYNAGNECVDHAVESYLISGTVPQNGLFCAAS